MLGYLNNKKATDEMLDSDGWLHTGKTGGSPLVLVMMMTTMMIAVHGYTVPMGEGIEECQREPNPSIQSIHPSNHPSIILLNQIPDSYLPLTALETPSDLALLAAISLPWQICPLSLHFFLWGKCIQYFV